MGKYVFNLTVYDEQGLFDSNKVVFTVNNDPKLYYLIEITINVEANKLTELQYGNLKGKLALLVRDGTRLQVKIFYIKNVGLLSAKISENLKTFFCHFY